jgi:hypothetical protein
MSQAANRLGRNAEGSPQGDPARPGKSSGSAGCNNGVSPTSVVDATETGAWVGLNGALRSGVEFGERSGRRMGWETRRVRSVIIPYRDSTRARSARILEARKRSGFARYRARLHSGLGRREAHPGPACRKGPVRRAPTGTGAGAGGVGSPAQPSPRSHRQRRRPTSGCLGHLISEDPSSRRTTLQ